MNILIPHTWLLEHLNTSASPEDIQRLLSLSGPSVERIHDIEGEPVYDIEVTTNRVDSMSVRGIAREAAVILSQAGFPSILKTKEEAKFEIADPLPLPKIVNDPKLCKRILCIVIKDVKKVPSPDWIQKRLKQIGVNTHDAVIDITNYVTHELGHPCHAFDYDKIMKLGGTIIVKEAEAGKKFAIIDGTEFETVGGEVVFENEAREIIDLPAIKGTKNTSIADDTKHVLFWIENLDPQKVRFASMTHAIRTVAAQLSEKNVDPNLGLDVLKLGAKLLTELAQGKIASEIHDEFPGKTDPAIVAVKEKKFVQYLGITLKPSKIQEMLERLEMKVSYSDNTFFVTPPTFRPDILIPVDVIEEVARIYGYHNLPSTLMTGNIPTERTADRFDIEHQVKEFLATLGAYEVYTYSLIDESQAKLEAEFVHPGSKSEDGSKTHIKLKNPLTDDMVYLRRTLWSQHLRVLENNVEPKELGIFEFANVYIPTTDGQDVDRTRRQESKSKDKNSEILPFEELHLTITARGSAMLETERYIKGMVEALAHKYYMSPLRYVPNEAGRETFIYSGDTIIGQLLYPSTFSLSPLPFALVLDIDWRTFLSLVKAYPKVKSESKFTPVTQDLTFTIPEKQHIQRVMETIQAVNTDISQVQLKDIYKRNITFTVSFESDHQLTTEEASGIKEQIAKTVKEKHQGELVGK